MFWRGGGGAPICSFSRTATDNWADMYNCQLSLQFTLLVSSAPSKHQIRLCSSFRQSLHLQFKKSLSHYSYQRYWLPVIEVHNFTSSSCMIRYSYFHSWCAHVRKKSQIWSAWQMFAKLSVTITLSREFFFFCFFLYEYPELQKTNFVFWSPGYSVCNIDLVCRQPYSWWPPSKAQVQSAWCPLHWDCHEVSARLVFGKAHNLHKWDTWKIMFLNCRKRFDDMIDHLRDLYVHVVVKN